MADAPPSARLRLRAWGETSIIDLHPNAQDHPVFDRMILDWVNKFIRPQTTAGRNFTFLV
jgi:hypothetical protein